MTHDEWFYLGMPNAWHDSVFGEPMADLHVDYAYVGHVSRVDKPELGRVLWRSYWKPKGESAWRDAGLSNTEDEARAAVEKALQ